MAYVKQTWVDGTTPLDAAHLNHMEEGIEKGVQAEDLAGAVKAALASETWTFVLKDGTTVTKKVVLV